MSFLSSSKSKSEKPKKEKKAKAPKEPKPKKEKKSKRKKETSADEEFPDVGDFSEPQPPTPRVVTPKRLDVYALILLLSWLLLVAACILTYLDIASYNK